MTLPIGLPEPWTPVLEQARARAVEIEQLRRLPSAAPGCVPRRGGVGCGGRVRLL